MTRRQTRRAVPLCVLFAGLVAGHLLRATPVAHAQADPNRPRADSRPAEVALTASSARLRTDGSLSDVAGLSQNNVWAVGQQDVWDFWQNGGAIRHWNGSTWAEVAVRNDTTGAGHLRSIAASSAAELWVVGDGHDGLPYVARGGPSGFDRQTVPQLRAGDWLGAVAALSGRVVTVGSRDGKTFMATRTGGSWTTVHGSGGAMYGVSLSGRTDGWAVGDSGTRPLIMRLTATGWKAARLPEIKGGFLRDVFADGTKNAIAIGGVYHAADSAAGDSGGGDEGEGTIEPLVLHWDGKRWARVDFPDRRVELYGVTGDGDGTFWVSGYDERHPGEALLLRYADSKWSVIRGRATEAERTVRLQAVTHVGELTMAVGHVLDANDRYHDLVETFGPAVSE